MVNETEKPTRVDEMRKRYIEHHEGETPGAGGWADPGGTVSQNINTEGASRRFDLLNTPMGGKPHVCGGWPR